MKAHSYLETLKFVLLGNRPKAASTKEKIFMYLRYLFAFVLVMVVSVFVPNLIDPKNNGLVYRLILFAFGIFIVSILKYRFNYRGYGFFYKWKSTFSKFDIAYSGFIFVFYLMAIVFFIWMGIKDKIVYVALGVSLVVTILSPLERIIFSIKGKKK
jgi:hypothetical protein